MKLFQFFRFHQSAVHPLNDETLGPLQWHERAWVGSYNGFRFDIAGKRDGPPRDLIAYATALLGDGEHLFATLGLAKHQFMADFPEYTDEIEALTFDSFSIIQHRRERRGIGWLRPEGLRLWHTEYLEKECKGLTFDS